MRTKFIFLLLGLCCVFIAQGQMLFTESMTMVIDSTKTIQGTISPTLDFKTEREHVFTFKGAANLNVLLGKKRVINLINKFELSTYGKQLLLSGGYVHAEYRYLLDRQIEVYPYMESQWAESRGMLAKLSMGLQSRYRLVNSHSIVMFATAGLFFEYEKWKHSSEGNHELIKKSYLPKTHLDLSLRHQISDDWKIIITGIHQASINKDFMTPRYGCSVDLSYALSKHLKIKGAYRLIYDTNPIVPIREGYNTVETTLDISF